MKLNRNAYIVILVFLLTFILLSAYQREGISPFIKVSGDHDWKRIDTEFCRVYYYEQESYAKKIAKDIDSIYKDITNMFGHYTKLNLKEDGFVTFLLLDDKTYKKFSKGGSRASWQKTFGLINIDMKKKNSNINSTLKHELIHAVTCFSDDTKVKKIPGWFSEGVAQYYQFFSRTIVKDAFDNGKLVSWKTIESRSSSDWGKENIGLKYLQAASVYDFLINTYGKDRIDKIFYSRGDFYDILKQVTSKSVNELEEEWQEYIKNKYTD